jgi:hypothetical protein
VSALKVDMRRERKVSLATCLAICSACRRARAIASASSFSSSSARTSSLAVMSMGVLPIYEFRRKLKQVCVTTKSQYSRVQSSKYKNSKDTHTRSRTLKSAPDSSNKRVKGRSPLKQALCNGVLQLSFAELTSAPISMRFFAKSKCPAQHARASKITREILYGSSF